MTTIKNPILPGFNPDPCIVRVGDDYYIAVSSFEWMPGIPVYHSKDLVNWRLAACALNSGKFADMTGIPASKGVWAPCLSYCDGKFYLLYSVVYSSNRWNFDVENFLITCDNIGGEWSEPVFINASGFDASLFHDGGSKWVVSKERDFRADRINDRPIIVQEFCEKQGKLIGEPVRLTTGATSRSFTEGAHIYKRGEYYYLMTAEGGTGYGHSVCLLRSESVTGPYEACLQNPILTSCPGEFTADEARDFMMPEKYTPETVIQKSGHGSLIETQSGEWYIVHLCARPLMPEKRCVLGRETAIQQVEWTDDGWLRLTSGGNVAQDSTPAPKLTPHPFPKEENRCHFDVQELPLDFFTPRNMFDLSWVELSSRPGWLRLRGRNSLTSNRDTSIVAKKLRSLNSRFTVKMEYNPTAFQHMAGLTCYYDSATHYAISKTYDERTGGCVIRLGGFVNAIYTDCGSSEISVSGESPVWLRAEIESGDLQFSYSLHGENYLKLGSALDLSVLSDEASSFGKFTGAFAGIFAQDAYLRDTWAEFDYFEEENL